jgi:hypothetical protein
MSQQYHYHKGLRTHFLTSRSFKRIDYIVDFLGYHPVLKCFCGNADPCHCSPWKGKGLKKEPHQTLKSAGYISVVACLFEHWQLDDVVPKASASMSGAFVKQQELNLHLSGQSQVCDPISRNTGIKNPALKNVKIHVSDFPVHHITSRCSSSMLLPASPASLGQRYLSFARSAGAYSHLLVRTWARSILISILYWSISFDVRLHHIAGKWWKMMLHSECTPWGPLAIPDNFCPSLAVLTCGCSRFVPIVAGRSK